MTIRVAHLKVSNVPDALNTDAVRPSDWNADHVIEGLGTAAEADTGDFLQPGDIGVSVQAHSSVLDNTTASFTTTNEAKLAGIEGGADVTDAVNVAAAGAIMASVLTARGDIIRRGSSAPERLALGMSGRALKSNGTDVVWAASREVLTTNRTYYVRTDGSDSNTGLVDSTGGAFLTIQKALNVILGTLDLGGFNVTIDVANGTYTGAISFASAQIGAGNIAIVGDTTTPSNVVIGVVTVDGAGCRLFLQGVKVDKGAGQYCVKAVNGGYIRLVTNNQFASTSAGHRVSADNGGLIDAAGNEIIEGTVAGAHYIALNNGVINVATSITWTASGTAAQGIAFVLCQTSGVVFAFLNTSSGTFTGPRYSAGMNGTIQTNGGGASYFPGSTTGSTATGGQYA